MSETLFEGHAPSPKHEVTITVSGLCGTGRIAMAQRITSMLRDYGIEAPDVVNEEGPGQLTHAEIHDALRIIADSVSVRVR